MGLGDLNDSVFGVITPFILTTPYAAAFYARIKECRSFVGRIGEYDN